MIEKNIRAGIYKAGHKLPSVRTLKERHQTSISTIQNGYEYLIIAGLVESIPKSGYFVSNQFKENRIERVPGSQPVLRDAIFSSNLALTTAAATRPVMAEFNVAAPGDLMIPQKLLLRTMQQVIREQGAGLLRYYPANGSLALRNSIVKRAAGYQTPLVAEELIITDGALQALYIALAAVCQAGDVVAVESPCVFSALEVIRMLKLRVLEIPLDQQGLDIQGLRAACELTRISAILVTPNFQNPTGICLSDAQKIELLDLAKHHGIALIENDIYGDLNFSGARPSTLKSFDDSGLVLTYSSYSKTLAAGIRLGWLSAGKFFKEAEQLKFSMGSTVSPVYQETVLKLLESGAYDRHIRKFRMQLARNAYDTINLLAGYFPENTKLLIPAGGYNIWFKMPDNTDMNDFYAKCEQIGIRFTPGHTFSFSNVYHLFFRIVFADQYSSKKKEALKRAGQLTR